MDDDVRNDEDFDAEEFDAKKLDQSLELAEILAKVSMMTPSAAKNRLMAKSLELNFGRLDDGHFVPPKQLLMYLVRMGSFNSSPKIINDDILDNDIHLPSEINRQELLHFCQKQQSVYPMVKRNFQYAEEDLDLRKSNGLSEDCKDYSSNSNFVRVFQWNILSQALGQMNDNFVRCPEEALEWNFRRFHIIEEIVEYSPDIICLQEVDHFNFLKHVLNTQGYVGMFYPKPDSPCFYIHGNNGPDGCAIFFRRNKFQLLKTESKILEIWKVQSNQVVLLNILRIIETGQEICVAATHLKARNGALLSTLRNEQGKDLLNFVDDHSEGRPVILCGDFNAVPIEPVYQTITNYKPLKLSSAYADCQKSPLNSALREPPYTTWKIREEGEVCHTIDYIFYSSDKLKVSAVLGIPKGEDIGEDRIPSFRYPSDHFSLAGDFEILGGK